MKLAADIASHKVAESASTLCRDGTLALPSVLGKILGGAEPATATRKG